MSFAERYLNRPILLEICPAIVFFVVNYGWGLMPATAAVMAASAIAVGSGLVLERRVPVLAVVTLILVLLLGGASLALNDEVFIKMKPTVGNGLFAGALATGLFFERSFLARALESQVQLTDRGWRVLTLCWIAIALSAAALNELLWRSLDTDSWVAFKTGLSPALIVCYIAVTRLLAPYYWQDESEEGHGT